MTRAPEVASHRRLRIAVDAASIGAEPSGARTRLIALLRAYAALARRHDLLVLAPSQARLEAEFAGVDVELVAVPPPRRPAWRLIESPAARRRLLAAHAIDVLQVETLPVPRAPGVPLLLTVHDLRDLDALTPRLHPRALYARLALPRALRRVAQVIAVSQDTARRLAALGVAPERLAVVQNAAAPGVARVDDVALLAAFRERYRVSGRFVLALGHVEPRKNLAVLIDALALLRAAPAFADVALMLIGRDRVGEGVRLAAAARRLGVPLVLTGSLSDAERNAALSLASVVAAPSRVEGFGMVPIEAMSIGVPVVAARTTAVPEVVGDAALLIEPDDRAALAFALAQLLGDAAARNQAIARGHAQAARWSWARSALALRAVHDRLADAGALPPRP